MQSAKDRDSLVPREVLKQAEYARKSLPSKIKKIPKE
jgi:hypothetical protein